MFAVACCNLVCVCIALAVKDMDIFEQSIYKVQATSYKLCLMAPGDGHANLSLKIDDACSGEDGMEHNKSSGPLLSAPGVAQNDCSLPKVAKANEFLIISRGEMHWQGRRQLILPYPGSPKPDISTPAGVVPTLNNLEYLECGFRNFRCIFAGATNLWTGWWRSTILPQKNKIETMPE